MKPQVGLKKHKTAKSPARLTKEKTHITIIRNEAGDINSDLTKMK